jgi:ABC-type multidrug transport system fused ATPase/permease subunit
MKIKRSSAFSRLLKIAESKKTYLILSAVLAVISSAFSLVPYIIVYLVMAALLTPDFGTKDYVFIRQMVLAAVVIVVLRYMLLFASLMFSHVAAFSILYGLRTRLAAHLGKLPMGYFTSNQTVESFTRLKSAAMAYKYFVERITMELAPPWAMFIVITSSGLVFILPFGLWFYHAGYITLPTLLLFLMLGSGYMTPLFKLAMLGGQMSHVMEGVKRMDTILQTPPMSEPAYSVSSPNAAICSPNCQKVWKRASARVARCI